MSVADNQKIKPQHCPFLGTAEDRGSIMAFASDANACYRQDQLRAVELSYQRSYCLGPAHSECTLFLDDQAPLPAGVRPLPQPWYRRWLRSWRAVAQQ